MKSMIFEIKVDSTCIYTHKMIEHKMKVITIIYLLIIIMVGLNVNFY